MGIHQIKYTSMTSHFVSHHKSKVKLDLTWIHRCDREYRVHFNAVIVFFCRSKIIHLLHTYRERERVSARLSVKTELELVNVTVYSHRKPFLNNNKQFHFFFAIIS